MPYKSKDDENITKTMQPRKGGIYMDREDGKLPEDRVSKYYQETNPKKEHVNPFAEKLKKEQAAEAAARAEKKKKAKESDTWYNDTANDGNMVSRALRKAESYLPGPSGQGGNTTFGISKKL